MDGQCKASFDCDACGKSQVEVEIERDRYGSDVSFDIKDSSDNTVMEGTSYLDSSTRSDYGCLMDGSYTFTIYDSYGDAHMAREAILSR